MTVGEDFLALAGTAACLLEDMGFVAVARKRDGVVTLELWIEADGKRVGLRRVVSDDSLTPEQLATACATALRQATTLH